MFHGKHFSDRVEKAAAYAAVPLEPDRVRLLAEFGGWLAGEGLAAGGIGPAERDRIVDRHLADSLVFAAAWNGVPDTLLDVGSGVGLPGIPLAIAYPASAVTLVDRSGERCRLARRSIRVLGLENVTVLEGDVSTIDGDWDVVTFRASLSPERAFTAAVPLLRAGGTAVVGASRTKRPVNAPPAPPGTVVDIVEIDEGVLDSPGWLLRMTVT